MAAPEPPTTSVAGPAEDRIPTVIASDVSITYRIYGSGRAVDDDDEMGVLKRVLQRSTQNVGVREVKAVKNVSLVAYEGESIGLVGRNGSGKSTLLRSIAGLVPPTGGRLWLRGKAALLGVNAVLLPNLSGRDNIWIGAQALGLTPKEVRARFDEIVDFADLGEFIGLPMKSYSSGMAARLRFAISTAVVPDILVVDEALATGDAQFRERAQDRIAEIRGAAGTVFMVSHNPGTIVKMCDRALWLDDGELVMDGPAGPVVDAYTAKYGRPRKKPGKGKPAPEDPPEKP
ncbi:teichoic acid ABC transporter ATP-binding protein [Ornithinimicrobium sp. CNJ-824]|uniref:ABC transporter ATP-binding protein n=1 Tax=Ornithinimicrobium sp. CNJ-824 TaxID=1904966 RepID=UPI000965157F|nr:ABC transporter ATP-binding protein [Ornithinimicrobium sp. CNJ-824]OLT19545.1 teichoic acid ABC transporter ATP-binding protein [Ornithinimicrobium sp. CNJ-824]